MLTDSEFTMVKVYNRVITGSKIWGHVPNSAALRKWHRNDTRILPPASWPCVRRPPLLLFWNVSHHVFGLKPPNLDHWMVVQIFFKRVLKNWLPVQSIILWDSICLSSSHTRVTSQNSLSFLKNFCQFPLNFRRIMSKKILSDNSGRSHGASGVK